MPQLLEEKFRKIKNLIFDVDGVFTDATLIVSDTDSLRTYNVRDGYAVHIAAKAGYRLAVITGGKQKSIKTRLTGLGVQDVFYDVPTDKKLETFDNYMAVNGLRPEETLYVGDDIPDYLLMTQRPIMKICPVDAVPEVKEIVDYISPYGGGRGVVREVIERVMKAQGTWLTVF